MKNSEVRLMDFLVQMPAINIGARVKYDSQTNNLYTINEGVVGEVFYQTFGDIVMNFDKDSGRLYSIDGRINLDAVEKSDYSFTTDCVQANLIAGSRSLRNLGDDVDYSFDKKSRILTAARRGQKTKNIFYAQVLENARIGLSEQGELLLIAIML